MNPNNDAKFWSAVFADECEHYVELSGWFDKPLGCPDAHCANRSVNMIGRIANWGDKPED